LDQEEPAYIIYLQIFASSATHWWNMVSLVLDVFPVSGLVVVVALVGMSEKRNMQLPTWAFEVCQASPIPLE
jgi:hypothetical protein